jgi:antitoxin component HigA of HigAB toxin-antitoxin module
MELQGLTVEDLEPLIGRANRADEVLAHKRPLTLQRGAMRSINMARRLRSAAR